MPKRDFFETKFLHPPIGKEPSRAIHCVVEVFSTESFASKLKLAADAFALFFDREEPLTELAEESALKLSLGAPQQIRHDSRLYLVPIDWLINEHQLEILEKCQSQSVDLESVRQESGELGAAYFFQDWNPLRAQGLVFGEAKLLGKKIEGMGGITPRGEEARRALWVSPPQFADD